MPTTFTATKLRNALHGRDNLRIEVKNVRVNGATLGCSGFITNVDNGLVVYVNTDHNHGMNTRALYRRARDTRDYVGGTNHYADYSDIGAAIRALLESR